MSHLALNSSKDSSWCSERMREEVLKLGRAATRGRAAGARMVVARKKEVAGPRAAIRRRDIFYKFFKGDMPEDQDVGIWGRGQEGEKKKREWVVTQGEGTRTALQIKSGVESVVESVEVTK